MSAPKSSLRESPGAGSDWRRKPWGETYEAIHTPAYALHMLRIEAGGFCSRHLHKKKSNRFLVRSGVLLVRVWAGPECIETILQAGEHLDVPPWTLHQFEAREACDVWEIYVPATPASIVEREDIVRVSHGGRRAA